MELFRILKENQNSARITGGPGGGTLSSKKGPLRCREKVGLKGAGFRPP